MRKLPESLREELRKPFGRVISKEQLVSELKGKDVFLISVGDECSYELIKGGVKPDIVIYDLKIKRKDVIGKVRELLDGFNESSVIVHNPPGVIMDELVETTKEMIERRRGKMLVRGEEDLAALVVMIYAPNGSVVVYGQPDEGAVLVEMNDEVRDRALRVYESMEE
jgi:hypothetical protein